MFPIQFVNAGVPLLAIHRPAKLLNKNGKG